LEPSGIDASNLDPFVSSLCVPVPKGAEITVSTWARDGGFVPQGVLIEGLTLSWLPLEDAAWRFGPADAGERIIQARAPGSSYIAETDGFVVGVVCAARDGARGYLEINASDDGSAADPLYAACATHIYSGHKRWITGNTAMLPVSAGRKWSATATATCFEISPSLYWIPVTPA
jgi:hypothetical protein